MVMLQDNFVILSDGELWGVNPWSPCWHFSVFHPEQTEDFKFFANGMRLLFRPTLIHEEGFRIDSIENRMRHLSQRC